MGLTLAMLQSPEALIGGGAVIMILIVALGIEIAVIWGCYTLAERKGYNAPLAAVLGFIFGIWALLV